MGSTNRMDRRLSTIVAVDVVGYTRLMEADETGTLALLKSRRRELLKPLAERHGGHRPGSKWDVGPARSGLRSR
jgi:class 3 adenylate cyclase